MGGSFRVGAVYQRNLPADSVERHLLDICAGGLEGQ
jgi:hypothetical protein